MQDKGRRPLVRTGGWRSTLSAAHPHTGYSIRRLKRLAGANALPPGSVTPDRSPQPQRKAEACTCTPPAHRAPLATNRETCEPPRLSKRFEPAHSRCEKRAPLRPKGVKRMCGEDARAKNYEKYDQSFKHRVFPEPVHVRSWPLHSQNDSRVSAGFSVGW
jgi:hypothetical protein